MINSVLVEQVQKYQQRELVYDKQFLLEPKKMNVSISYFHLHLCRDGRCSLSTLIRASAWLGILSQRKYVCGLMETHPSILISNTRCSAMATRETESLIILGIKFFFTAIAITYKSLAGRNHIPHQFKVRIIEMLLTIICFKTCFHLSCTFMRR